MLGQGQVKGLHEVFSHVALSGRLDGLQRVQAHSVPVNVYEEECMGTKAMLKSDSQDQATKGHYKQRLLIPIRTVTPVSPKIMMTIRQRSFDTTGIEYKLFWPAKCRIAQNTVDHHRL